MRFTFCIETHLASGSDFSRILNQGPSGLDLETSITKSLVPLRKLRLVIGACLYSHNFRYLPISRYVVVRISQHDVGHSNGASIILKATRTFSSVL